MGILSEPIHKYFKRVWATKNAVRPRIAKRHHTVKKVLYVSVKKVLYVFFFLKKWGPVLQLHVPKGRTVTGAFYENVVVEKV